MRPVRTTLVVDAALALALVVVGQLEVAFGSVGYLGSAPHAVSAALAALIPLPLTLRRRTPLLGCVLVGAMLALPTVVVDRDIPFWGGPMTLLVALYSASRFATPPRDRYALVVPAATVGSIAAALPEFRSGNEVAFSAIVFGVGWSAGQVMRGWERRHQQLGSDLLTLAESAALREQAAATAERTRIARELHDVVAHSVSVMVVQAGSARLRMRRDPRGAEEALLAVESTGRQALGELRQLLGLLRTDAAPTGVEPQPGLASLDTLVEQARDSGLDVTVQVVGPVRALPPGLDLSAYRIVQEALTNVRKHTGPAAVTVRLQYDVTSLDLRVHNASGHRQARLAGGAPLGRGRGGHGLLGMRERVSLFGGRVDAGPDGDGGFLVHATLPLPVTGEPVTTPAEWTP